MDCRSIVNGALRKIGRLGAGREPRAVDSTDTLAALQGMYFSWIATGAFGRLQDVIPVTDYVARCGERIFRNQSQVSSITLPETVSRWQWWDCDRWGWGEEQRHIDYTKTSAENLYFAYDFSDRLNGHTISAVQHVTSTPFGPSGLVNGGYMINGTSVSVLWGGGISSGLYQTSVIILDSVGESIEVDGNIYVKDTQQSTNVANQVTPRDGSPVTITDAFTAQTVSFIYNGFIKEWQSIDDLSLDGEAPLSTADPEGLKAALALEIADMFAADVPPTTLRQAGRFQTILTSRFSMPRQEVPAVYF